MHKIMMFSDMAIVCVCCYRENRSGQVSQTQPSCVYLTPLTQRKHPNGSHSLTPMGSPVWSGWRIRYWTLCFHTLLEACDLKLTSLSLFSFGLGVAVVLQALARLWGRSSCWTLRAWWSRKSWKPMKIVYERSSQQRTDMFSVVLRGLMAKLPSGESIKTALEFVMCRLQIIICT